jgi:hypothetical protein
MYACRVRDKRVLIVVVTAVALACWAGLIHRDQQQQRAATAAAVKAPAHRMRAATAAHNCSSPQPDQSGQAITVLVCSSRITSTTTVHHGNIIWVEFAGVAALALAFASTPLLQRPRAS